MNFTMIGLKLIHNFPFGFFYQSNFDEPGSEFVTCEPVDFKESPAFLECIKDPDYRQWASDLNAFWKQLCRQMTDDVAVSQNIPFQYFVGFFR